MTTEQAAWPLTVEQAVDHIIGGSAPHDLDYLAFLPQDALGGFHHTWGQGIRNGFGLWKGNTALLADCRRVVEQQGKDPDAFYKEQGYPVPLPMHPDDASGVIMEMVWQKAKEIVGVEGNI